MMMTETRLFRTWLILLMLTGLSGAGLALAQADGTVFIATAVLAAAGFLKARLILSDYLELRRALGWMSAFTAVLAALMLLIYGLAFFRLAGM